jgi:hypothetical protein
MMQPHSRIKARRPKGSLPGGRGFTVPGLTRGAGITAMVAISLSLAVASAALAAASAPETPPHQTVTGTTTAKADAKPATKSAAGKKNKKAKGGKSKPSSPKSTKSASKPEKKSDTWFARYDGPNMRLEYPIMDRALAGILGTMPSSPTPVARPTRPASGKVDPLVGAVVRREDEKPAEAVPTPGEPIPPPPGSHEPEMLPPLPAEARIRPGPSLPPDSPEVRRYANLYMKSAPSRGWWGAKKRVKYLPVKPEFTWKDRWNVGFPDYRHHERSAGWYNPYMQNILKGDIPFYGDRHFMVLLLENQTTYEERHLPTPSNVPALRPASFPVFGRPGQDAFRQAFVTSFTYFNGTAGFEPPKYQFKITPIFNVDNTFRVREVAVTQTDPRFGRERERSDIGIQELFGEWRIVDTSPYFDFLSVRAGRQIFNSDFRGFMFKNANRGIRFFGNGAANRNSYNLVVFDMLEYETNSQLLRWEDAEDRNQTVVIANGFRQDFMNIEGYTVTGSYHYNEDDPSFLYDLNGRLVRPDPVGRFRQHQIRSHTLGFGGDGKIGGWNVSHQFYHAFGRDTFNPLADRPIRIDAQMASMELSYDEDWLRYRLNLFYASGDEKPTDGEGGGFDAILDDTNFAGGPFSFWVRQGIGLQGVLLKQGLSLLPDLRSSKLQGQQNFVNPGLQLVGVGFDAEITPKLKTVFNLNLIRFDATEPLELFIYQDNVPRGVGIDYGLGVIYRPELNQNIVTTFGVAGFMPGDGFKSIYESDKGLYQAFADIRLTY